MSNKAWLALWRGVVAQSNNLPDNLVLTFYPSVPGETTTLGDVLNMAHLHPRCWQERQAFLTFIEAIFQPRIFQKERYQTLQTQFLELIQRIIHSKDQDKWTNKSKQSEGTLTALEKKIKQTFFSSAMGIKELIRYCPNLIEKLFTPNKVLQENTIGEQWIKESVIAADVFYIVKLVGQKKLPFFKKTVSKKPDQQLIPPSPQPKEKITLKFEALISMLALAYDKNLPVDEILWRFLQQGGKKEEIKTVLEHAAALENLKKISNDEAIQPRDKAFSAVHAAVFMRPHTPGLSHIIEDCYANYIAHCSLENAEKYFRFCTNKAKYVKPLAEKMKTAATNNARLLRIMISLLQDTQVSHIGAVLKEILPQPLLGETYDAVIERIISSLIISIVYPDTEEKKLNLEENKKLLGDVLRHDYLRNKLNLSLDQLLSLVKLNEIHILKPLFYDSRFMEMFDHLFRDPDYRNKIIQEYENTPDAFENRVNHLYAVLQRYEIEDLLVYKHFLQFLSVSMEITSKEDFVHAVEKYMETTKIAKSANDIQKILKEYLLFSNNKMGPVEFCAKFQGKKFHGTKHLSNLISPVVSGYLDYQRVRGYIIKYAAKLCESDTNGFKEIKLSNDQSLRLNDDLLYFAMHDAKVRTALLPRESWWGKVKSWLWPHNANEIEASLIQHSTFAGAKLLGISWLDKIKMAPMQPLRSATSENTVLTHLILDQLSVDKPALSNDLIKKYGTEIRQLLAEKITYILPQHTARFLLKHNTTCKAMLGYLCRQNNFNFLNLVEHTLIQETEKSDLKNVLIDLVIKKLSPSDLTDWLCDKRKRFFPKMNPFADERIEDKLGPAAAKHPGIKTKIAKERKLIKQEEEVDLQNQSLKKQEIKEVRDLVGDSKNLQQQTSAISLVFKKLSFQSLPLPRKEEGKGGKGKEEKDADERRVYTPPMHRNTISALINPF